MNFDESVKYLYSLGNEVDTMKLGLENIGILLSALENPQNNYKKVQVAGTNGKGSVCAFLNSICREAGIGTGMYTSPHLVSITERIKIDGEDISESEFARLATFVRGRSEKLVSDGVLESVPTFFEQVTAIALAAFADASVELAILETGLGGRFDATTAANAEIAAITRIDLDHQEYLGETIEEIAAEKAAIITDKTSSVVIGAQTPAVMRFLRKHCKDLGIEPLNDEYAPWGVLPEHDSTVKVITTLQIFPGVTLGLKGRHQIENAQTAIQLAKALRYDFEIEEEDVFNGLQHAQHLGRLEYQGRFLFDGAHNIGGATALKKYLDEFVTQPITMIFGAIKGKDIAEIADILFPKADKLILTRSENSRSMKPSEIMPFISERSDRQDTFLTDTVQKAIEKGIEISGNESLILVTGSLYLVGDAKRLLAEPALN